MGNPAPPQFQTVEFGDERGRDTSIQPGNFANAGTRPFHLTSLKYQVLRHDPNVNQWWSSEADFTQSPCIEAVSKHMKKQFVPPRRVGLNAKMWERLGPFAPRGVSNLNDTPMNWTLGPRQISVNIRVLFMSVYSILITVSVFRRGDWKHRYRRGRGQVLFVFSLPCVRECENCNQTIPGFSPILHIHFGPDSSARKLRDEVKMTQLNFRDATASCFESVILISAVRYEDSEREQSNYNIPRMGRSHY